MFALKDAFCQFSKKSFSFKSELHWNVALNSAKENTVAISLDGPYMFVSGVVSMFLPGKDMFSHLSDTSLAPFVAVSKDVNGLVGLPVGGRITTS